MSTSLQYSSLETTSRWKNLPPPPGFSKASSSSKGNLSSKAVATPSTTPEAYDQLKDKRAWDLAISPAKSLPMQFFMLYMSGSGVQIFSMGIIFMLLSSPFKNIAGMNEAFASFAPSASKNPKSLSTLTLQKLAYFACNLLTLGVGLWKCRSMGLLPTGTGDWLAFETRGPAPELSLL
ncbi:endoplasmic reticulum protein [Lentinula raphanica]|nr:endoplasmic reticulum protein [Lentinula raphanica]KAJ3759730.1 endoplasmic reticulum protein [Lentinula raphanica]KAJ3770315.1 endoplasmic reticulum protein [Lentinula raphanica]